MEFLIFHLIKYLMVAAILLYGGFPRGQAIAAAVVLGFLELSLKVWLGQQFVAVYDAAKGIHSTEEHTDPQK